MRERNPSSLTLTGDTFARKGRRRVFELAPSPSRPNALGTAMAWTRRYDEAEPQRVIKWLAQNGVCSRREAEGLDVILKDGGTHRLRPPAVGPGLPR